MGPFHVTNEYVYILVAVDYISKWMEAATYRNYDRQTIIKFLKEYILSKLGVPKLIISDRGFHFYSRAFKNMMKKYNITYKTSTSYHPQSNGQMGLANRK